MRASRAHSARRRFICLASSGSPIHASARSISVRLASAACSQVSSSCPVRLCRDRTTLRGHRYSKSVAQEGGTTTGSTWALDGKRREAEPSKCGVCSSSPPALQAEANGFSRAWSHRCARLPSHLNHTLLGQRPEPAVASPGEGGKVGPGGGMRRNKAEVSGEHLAKDRKQPAIHEHRGPLLHLREHSTGQDSGC